MARRAADPRARADARALRRRVWRASAAARRVYARPDPPGMWRGLTGLPARAAQNPGVSSNILFGRVFNPALTKAIRSNLTLLQAQVTPSTGRRLTADTLVYPNFNTRARARGPMSDPRQPRSSAAVLAAACWAGEKGIAGTLPLVPWPMSPIAAASFHLPWMYLWQGTTWWRLALRRKCVIFERANMAQNKG